MYLSSNICTRRIAVVAVSARPPGVNKLCVCVCIKATWFRTREKHSPDHLLHQYLSTMFQRRNSVLDGRNLVRLASPDFIPE
ncbi:hypothetical protein COCCADRAFT_113047 [Bipolaris zeicola 26-R-13]|uniref:Uncharacterized protein n=1 Tax=Cochliobolus carbonum (strain 26-R-13) TaxID=930089 RepID=W6XN40_COCC2|nr:uncharacterized protein COCCADRAFT_113047 [Bipolaris zeicola 26-R-13]EUC26913.1 hypothetical protein COCCADRAFT_113047 [Bipolaris zeicola 26-R-13]